VPNVNPGDPRPDPRTARGIAALALSKLPFALAWIPAVAAVFFLKYLTLNTEGQGGVDLRGVGILGRLSLFRADVIVCLVVVPIIMVVCTLPLSSRLSAGLVAGVSIFCILVCFAEAKSFYVLGRLLSFNLLRDFVLWSWSDPEAIRAHANLAGLLRVFILIAGVIVVSLWAGKQSRAILKDVTVRRRWYAASRLALLPLALIIALPRISRAHSGVESKSILVTAERVFWGWQGNQETTNEFSGLDASKLIEDYRSIAHAAPSHPDSRYWAKAADSDVVVFVFETGPAAMLPIDGNLDDLPNLRRLREHAFIAPHHYSTYPFTNRALFSVFSGWYPSDFMKDFVEEGPTLSTKGIVKELSDRGYQTAMYSPFPWEKAYDVQTNQAVGFKRLSFAHDSAKTTGVYTGSWKVKESFDWDSLHLMESDMNDWLAHGQHFFAAFAPQLGHDPWSDVSPDGKFKNPLDRGRPIMAVQDAYLGEILSVLEAHHRLDKTVIVVIADHGARTRMEDPNLQSGMIDDISFHVPMLLYVPQALKTTVTIPWVTSHIDLSPTLLDLLGIERDRSSEQGSPVWDSQLQDRTTFFFAGHFFSADGYYSHRQFFMWNDFFDSVYRDSQLHFSSADEVSDRSDNYRQVTDTIRRISDLQQRWVEVFAGGGKSISATAYPRK